MYQSNNQHFAIIIGAGGTGSWLASFLSRFNKNVIMVDGDEVEAKNLARQNFEPNDINKNKALVIAAKHEFELSVNSYLTSTDMLDEIASTQPEKTPIVIGAVDNNNTRLLINEWMDNQDNAIWIDGGNNAVNGQTIIHIKKDGSVVEGYESPMKVEPGLAVSNDDERRPDEISCAEQSESAPQSITANVMSATSIFNIITSLMSEKPVLNNHYTFNTITNSIQSQSKEEE